MSYDSRLSKHLQESSAQRYRTLERAGVPPDAQVSEVMDYITGDTRLRAHIPGTHIIVGNDIVGKFYREVPGKSIQIAVTVDKPIMEYDPTAPFSLDVRRMELQIKRLVEVKNGVEKLYSGIQVTQEEWGVLFDQEGIEAI